MPVLNVCRIYVDASDLGFPDTTIGYVNASDLDGTARNSHINYFIVDGASGKFIINASSGGVMIQANAQLDRETVSTYNLSIVAVDQGYPALTGSTSMLVTVEDVNDTPPKFTNLPNATRVIEDKPIGSVVFFCLGNDSDSDSTLYFTIKELIANAENGDVLNKTLVKVL